MELRNTRQKQAIREAFSEAARPLSPEEALAYAQAHYKRLGIATMYRNIKALVEDGWLLPVEVPGRSTRYEVAGKRHHHHFHCKGCDKVFEVEGCVASSKPRLPRGFRSTSHEFYLFGLCSGCSARNKQHSKISDHGGRGETSVC
ncbi:MAG TPA: transcriptional repressor [Terriglobales bacterium]|nr:transcriptional repressor [Terriglobales bacterium]